MSVIFVLALILLFLVGLFLGYLFSGGARAKRASGPTQQDILREESERQHGP